MSRVTPAQQRCLCAIFDLTWPQDTTRVTRIAASLSVTRATASVAIRRLIEAGLVRREGNAVSLTERGADFVLQTHRKRHILHRYLSRVLGVPEPAATADAGALEPILSPQTFCALCRQTRLHAATPRENPPLEPTGQ